MSILNKFKKGVKMKKGYLDQLQQLTNLTKDCDLISKGDRDELVKNNLVMRCDGYNVVSREGIAVLKSLGILE